MKGKVSPNSALDVREQARLYREQMGLEAAKRQGALSREERARKKRK
jgi:hypothetical protein